MSENLENIFQHTINYTLAELREMVLQPREYAYDENVHTFEGRPVYKITDEPLLPGEVFRNYPDNDKIEVSNLGRIKYNGSIMPQSEYRYGELKKGYLFVDVPGEIKEVHRLVALTWYQPPNIFNNSMEKWEVHHISDNGYDNRPSNLMWVRRSIHSQIHSNKQFKNWSSGEIKWKFDMKKILQKDHVLENSLSHLLKALECIKDNPQCIFPIYKGLVDNGIKIDDYTIILHTLDHSTNPEDKNRIIIWVSLCYNKDIASQGIFGTVDSYRFGISANYIEATQKIEVQCAKTVGGFRFIKEEIMKLKNDIENKLGEMDNGA